MSINPFDGDNGNPLALVNHVAQHTLRTTLADVAPGWRLAYGAEGGSCLAFEQNRTKPPHGAERVASVGPRLTLT